MQVNPTTGHLPGCYNDGHTGTIRPIGQHKPMCSEATATGARCSGIATRYGCLTQDPINPVLYYGFCNHHWNRHPDHNNAWDEDMSACANKIADDRDYSLARRRRIDQFNIQAELGIPAWSAESHLSPQRIKGVANAHKVHKNQYELQLDRLRNEADKEKLRLIFQNQLPSTRFTEEDFSMEESSSDSYEENSFLDADDSDLDDDASYESNDDSEASSSSSSDESEEAMTQPPQKLKRKRDDVDSDDRATKKPKR